MEINITTTSDKLDELMSALSKAQGQFRKLNKTSKGYHGMYADLNDIADATKSGLSENGLSITQGVSHMCVTSILGHSSGQHIIYTCNFPSDAKKSMEIGRDFTLMRRYALNGILNIYGDDDAEDPPEEFKEMFSMLERLKTVKQLIDWQSTYKKKIEYLKSKPNADVDISALIRQKKAKIEGENNG